jgi:hypothetical protein
VGQPGSAGADPPVPAGSGCGFGGSALEDSLDPPYGFRRQTRAADSCAARPSTPRPPVGPRVRASRFRARTSTERDIRRFLEGYFQQQLSKQSFIAVIEECRSSSFPKTRTRTCPQLPKLSFTTFAISSAVVASSCQVVIGQPSPFSCWRPISTLVSSMMSCTISAPVPVTWIQSLFALTSSSASLKCNSRSFPEGNKSTMQSNCSSPQGNSERHPGR